MTSPAAPQATDLVAQLLSQALGGAFDSLKGKVTDDVAENGEEYLHQAAEKIKEATSGLVTWAKQNPVKTAIAIAALAAVSTFLVRMMTSSHDPVKEEGDSPTSKEKSKIGRKSANNKATT